MNRCTCFVAVALVMAAEPAFAQTSVGYADPDDLDALFAYRLPDWGWRSWEGTFYFRGEGSDVNDRTDTNHDFRMSSRLDWFAESERRFWDLTVESETSLDIRNRSRDGLTRDSDRFGSILAASSTRRQYLGNTQFYALGGAGAR